MKKKWLSVLLAASLAVSSFSAMSLPTFADEEEEDYDEINVSWLVTMPLDPSATDPLVEAINEITEEVKKSPNQ